MANDTIVSFAYPAFHDELSDLVRKKAVLKLAFADQLAYVRNEGFRAPNLALPCKVLADLKSTKCEMARPRGQTSNSLLETLAEWNTYLERDAPTYRLSKSTGVYRGSSGPRG